MRINRWQRLKWTIPLILFITTIIDAALPAIFPVAFLGNSQIIVSHITLYYIMVFAFYFRDSNILLFSFIFGLFYDSYNTTVLGVYATLYLVIAYLIIQVKKFFPKKLPIHGMLFIIAIVCLDSLVFAFYSEIVDIAVPFTEFLVGRLSPTLIFNIVMAIILYFPTRGLLNWLGYEDYVIF
ncbi:rod shape-determining protein MreD [Aerococcaceae bacterium WGS1372]